MGGCRTSHGGADGRRTPRRRRREGPDGSADRGPAARRPWRERAQLPWAESPRPRQRARALREPSVVASPGMRAPDGPERWMAPTRPPGAEGPAPPMAPTRWRPRSAPADRSRRSWARECRRRPPQGRVDLVVVRTQRGPAEALPGPGLGAIPIQKRGRGASTSAMEGGCEAGGPPEGERGRRKARFPEDTRTPPARQAKPAGTRRWSWTGTRPGPGSGSGSWSQIPVWASMPGEILRLRGLRPLRSG